MVGVVAVVQRLFGLVLPDDLAERDGPRWPFLAAVAADPQDEVAALVLADSLDESRDPEHRRIAELVRVEVEMRPALRWMLACRWCEGTGVDPKASPLSLCPRCAGPGSLWTITRTVVGELPLSLLRAGEIQQWARLDRRRSALRTAADKDAFPDYVVADVLFRAGIPRPYVAPEGQSA